MHTVYACVCVQKAHRYKLNIFVNTVGVISD